MLTTYFKNPDHLPTNRPKKRIGGWMGMGGKKVDAVDYLTEKIKNLDNRIEVSMNSHDDDEGSRKVPPR